MADAMLKNKPSPRTPRPSEEQKEDSEKKDDGGKKSSKGKEIPGPSSAKLTAGVVTRKNKKSTEAVATRTSANFNSEVVSILKELNSKHNKVTDQLEKLSSRVDNIYESYSQENDFQTYDYDQYYDYENYESCETENVAPVDPDEQFDDASVSICSEPPIKKQKTAKDSVFKNISEKFNPKESVDSAVNEDLAFFINSTFRDGISDERQSELVKEIHRPSNCEALVKTKVNQSIWRLLKPNTQTDDVKMQTIQNNIIKSAVNVTKMLNEGGETMSSSMIELGTNALGLLGQTNKLINNKRKEFHKRDLDVKYHYLTSHNFPFTDSLYGDDVNKNVKEIQDMNRLSKNVGRGSQPGTSNRGFGFRGRRGFRFPGRNRGRGRGYCRGTTDYQQQSYNTSSSAMSKNGKGGAKK